MALGMQLRMPRLAPFSAKNLGNVTLTNPDASTFAQPQSHLRVDREATAPYSALAHYAIRCPA